MGKKKVASTGRAWSLLRLALRWVQKGGAFKRGSAFDLRLVRGYLKRLKPGGSHSDRLHHGEREFSFHESPAFHFKTPSMRLPRLPCITPSIDFHNDDDRIFYKCEKKNVFFDKESKTESSMDSWEGGVDDDDEGIHCGEFIEVEEDQGIDSKAEEFIAKFYEEMKLQRQLSLLRYNEMLRRGTS